MLVIWTNVWDFRGLGLEEKYLLQQSSMKCHKIFLLTNKSWFPVISMSKMVISSKMGFFDREWELGDWGPCSSSCDIGDQLQDVTCVSTDPRGRTVTVDDQKCIQLYRRKPEYRRSCNENIPCPYWTPVEEWSSVSHLLLNKVIFCAFCKSSVVELSYSMCIL